MNVYYALAALHPAPHTGGILIYTLVPLHCYNHGDGKLILETRLAPNVVLLYKILSVCTDAILL